MCRFYFVLHKHCLSLGFFLINCPPECWDQEAAILVLFLSGSFFKTLVLHCWKAWMKFITHPELQHWLDFSFGPQTRRYTVETHSIIGTTTKQCLLWASFMKKGEEKCSDYRGIWTLDLRFKRILLVPPLLLSVVLLPVGSDLVI